MNALPMLASVDLGSNSFRLQICQNNQGQPQVIENIKHMVRLAGGLDNNKMLDDASQQRALECLAQFGDRL
ncbi:exopolyphosphatase, partial [Kingella kingae]|nr:exopolyphosphatase [Kingella kingae]